MSNNKQIPIRCKGARYLSFAELKTFQGNLKKMSKENFCKLRNSILTHGWIAPVFVWNGNEILDGHGRIIVLSELLKEGYTVNDIPVVDIKARNKREAAQILLSINSNYQSITEEGLYEFMKTFEIELTNLDEYSMSDIDLAHFEAEYFIETGRVDDDHLPNENTIPGRVKPGDMFHLGDHRLLCGDAMRQSDIERVLGGEMLQMVFTDPPYDFTEDFLSIVFNVCSGHVFIMDADRNHARNIAKYYAYFKSFYVIYFKAPYWYFSLSQPLMNHTLVAHYHREKGKTGSLRGLHSVIEIGTRHDKKAGYAYAKHVETILPFIQKFSRRGGIILDPFGGSGTTIIVAEKVKRRCYMIELDPHNCDLILRRYEEYTGKKIFKNEKNLS